jgi:sec-independent protein translocase protein TatA
MFNLGMPEIVLILIVALVVLGPKKLPEMAKSLGKGLREFRKAADDLKESVEKDLRQDIGALSEKKPTNKPDSPPSPEAEKSETAEAPPEKAGAPEAPKSP